MAKTTTTTSLSQTHFQQPEFLRVNGTRNASSSQPGSNAQLISNDNRRVSVPHVNTSWATSTKIGIGAVGLVAFTAYLSAVDLPLNLQGVFTGITQLMHNQAVRDLAAMLVVIGAAVVGLSSVTPTGPKDTLKIKAGEAHLFRKEDGSYVVQKLAQRGKNRNEVISAFPATPSLRRQLTDFTPTRIAVRGLLLGLAAQAAYLSFALEQPYTLLGVAQSLLSSNSVVFAYPALGYSLFAIVGAYVYAQYQRANQKADNKIDAEQALQDKGKDKDKEVEGEKPLGLINLKALEVEQAARTEKFFEVLDEAARLFDVTLKAQRALIDNYEELDEKMTALQEEDETLARQYQESVNREAASDNLSGSESENDNLLPKRALGLNAGQDPNAAG